MCEILKVKRLTENAFIPTRGSPFSAGYDLKSAYDYKVDAHGKVLIKTDISISVPEGHYARVAPRSGMSWNNHTDVGAGVIDRDYTGNVGVVLFNHSNDQLTISKGDRVAQLILEKNSEYSVLEVDSLGETSRSDGGFGSTGK
jgi:dUTP pyrophosphatase